MLRVSFNSASETSWPRGRHPAHFSDESMLRTIVPAAVLTGRGRLLGDVDWTTVSEARCVVEQLLLVNESLVEVCKTNVFEIFFK